MDIMSMMAGRLQKEIELSDDEEEIRKDEREKVLDELEKFFTVGWFSQSKTVPRDVLLGKLEELRKGGG